MMPVARIVAVLIASTIMCSCGGEDPKAQAAVGQPVATSGAAEAAVVPASASAAAPAATTSDAVNQDAIKALDRMGAYLRTLSAFQIVSDTTRDDVLDDGQRIQFGGHVEMLVQRPDRLRAEVTSDRQQRFFFYDGKSFTLWARRVNYYATVPAPATLRELADRIQTKYGIEMPLGDLFYWGTEGHDGSGISAAADVGTSQIEGVTCEHYAFRQSDIDWQVWLQQGGYPLPRKLVITTTSEPARPQYTSVLTWNLAPSYNDAAFRFDPPAEAHRITFEEAPGGASSER
jgi:hypothetical protein